MWTPELTFDLIAKYKSYPELWDPSSAFYGVKKTKQMALETIANDLGVRVKMVLKKIHNLRTQFRQETRRYNKRRKMFGLSEKDKIIGKTWDYYDALKFVALEPDNERASSSINKNVFPTSEPTVKIEVDSSSTSENQSPKRRRLSEFPEQQNQDSEASYLNGQSSQSQHRTGPLEQQNQVSKPTSGTAQNRSDFSDQQNDTSLINQVQVPSYANRNEFELFGDYVVSEFRMLRTDKSRLLLRRKIQKAILEVAELDENENQ